MPVTPKPVDPSARAPATILIVPGLRDAVAEHWQARLETDLRVAGRPVIAVAPMGRRDLSCAARVDAIECAVRAIDGPVVLVAHSGGCIMVAHWVASHASRRHDTASRVRGALLATPPDFESPMPEGYPTLDALRVGGWLPVPRARLPFASIVAASRDDPLGSVERVTDLANAWGSRLVDLGAVGHLNPASGFGHWPRALEIVDDAFGPSSAA